MANSFFKFKSFVIHQDKTAMKVGTDGVLLGSWADVSGAQRILDVGTGTGLIAVMCAQRAKNALIDAVEIELGAFKQAQENFEGSVWKQRLSVVNIDFQSYSKLENKKYDLIVSNPPYFNNALKNDCIKKASARHTDVLLHDDLIKGAVQMLTATGFFAVVLPADLKEGFEIKAKENGLYLRRILWVKPTPKKEPKRVLIEFALEDGAVEADTMIIEEFGRHNYSEDYKKLTKEFYLAF